MKKQQFAGWLLLMCLMLSTNAWSQDKYFEEGLSKGRKKGDFYVASIGKGRPPSWDKLTDYAYKHHYLIGNKHTKEVNRFGDKELVIDAFNFLPLDEFPSYVLEKVTNGGFTINDLKQKGNCWIYDNKLGKFGKLNDVFWSGAIVDGLLDGKGQALWYNSDVKLFILFNCEFQRGIPLGTCNFNDYLRNREKPMEIDRGNYTGIIVGKMSEGLAYFKSINDNGLYGFVNSNGGMAIAPQFKNVVKEFSNGKAEVVNKDNQEIIIDKTGNYVDLTANQKRLIAEQKERERQEELKKQQEEKQRELARKQEQQERERQAIEHEKWRREKLKSARPGDKIYYIAGYTYQDNFLWWTIRSENFNMRVTCFIEQNIDNGERLQVRVGDVSSSSSEHYKTPKIDGIEYRKGDVLWIKPFEDRGWDF